MWDFHLILDTLCQISLALLMLALAYFLFKRAKSEPGQSWLARFAALKDDDQLMILAVFLVITCIPSAVGVVLFIIWTKAFDAVGMTIATALVSGLLGLGGAGMYYFFNQGHSGKKSSDALADIAAQP